MGRMQRQLTGACCSLVWRGAACGSTVQWWSGKEGQYGRVQTSDGRAEDSIAAIPMAKPMLRGFKVAGHTWLVTTSPCCVHSWTHAGADSRIRNFASELHALASRVS